MATMVTPRGKKRLEKLTFASFVIPKPENWNKKWWLVAADIPTKDHKLAADALRRKLKKMGFLSFAKNFVVISL